MVHNILTQYFSGANMFFYKKKNFTSHEYFGINWAPGKRTHN
jgi:hypothetical protein